MIKHVIATTKLAVLAGALALCMAVAVPSGLPLVGTASAAANKIQDGVNDISDGGSGISGLELTGSVKILINTFLFIIGIVAVIILIYGGFRYITSAGETSAVAAAKSTIMYAVIGLVVAILAYAIVNYVTGLFE